MIMVSGGPGGYVLLNRDFTLSLQANAGYESTARDQIIGQTFEETGGTAWFLGPLLNFTWGEHLSANAGVDIPLRIYNHRLQTVPDFDLRPSDFGLPSSFVICHSSLVSCHLPSAPNVLFSDACLP